MNIINNCSISNKMDLCSIKISLRQRTKQRVKLLWRDRVLSRKLLQQDEILQENQTFVFSSWAIVIATCHHVSSHQLLPTMFRCKALPKSICSTGSSSRRRTSCGLKSWPWTGWTEPHSHRNSRIARRARSWWARWSSANRLFAPVERQNRD